MKDKYKKMNLFFFLGLIGCVLMAGSDWLMIYGDTAFAGTLSWLTIGTEHISAQRNAFAMLLALPAVIFYSFGLLSINGYFENKKKKKTYSYLTALGLTPWLCLHLFYVMILFAFSFICANYDRGMAYKICEAMFDQFSWLVMLSQVLMLLPFLYLFYLTVTGKTKLNKLMCINNPLIIYVLLKLLTLLMPDAPFRLAFTNGLMSEAMLIWFLAFIIYNLVKAKKEK